VKSAKDVVFVKKQKEMNEQQILVRSITVLSEAAKKILQEVFASLLKSNSLIDLTPWNWYKLPALRHKSLYDAIAKTAFMRKPTKSSMDATEADKPSSRRSACLHQILSVMARYRFGNTYDFYNLQAQHQPCLQLMCIHNRFQVAQLSLLTLQIIQDLKFLKRSDQGLATFRWQKKHKAPETH